MKNRLQTKLNKLIDKIKVHLQTLKSYYSTPVSAGGCTLYSLHYHRISKTLVGSMSMLVMICLLTIDHPWRRFGRWIGLTAEAATLNDSSFSSGNNTSQKKVHHHGSAKQDYEIALISNSKHDLSKDNFLRVLLINDVDSSNQRSPLIFRITETFDEKIPVGSLAIGSVDTTSDDRIFGKIVGIKTSKDDVTEIDGEIMSTDGSSGLVGEVETHRGADLAGTAIGSFTAGAAAGLMQNNIFTAGTFQQNVRNSLLGGTSDTASRAADIYTSDLKSKKPTIHIKRGTQAIVLVKSF